jgi:hypothetical protein
MEWTRHLRSQAELTLARSVVLVNSSLERRVERRRWSSLRHTLYDIPEHMLVCCIYCGRVRTLEGDWMVLPPGVRRRRRLDISHGACTECLAELFPQWPGLSTPHAGEIESLAATAPGGGHRKVSK